MSTKIFDKVQVSILQFNDGYFSDKIFEKRWTEHLAPHNTELNTKLFKCFIEISSKISKLFEKKNDIH